MQVLKIGIAGLGTVGTGVVRLLEENGAEIAARCGREIRVTAVSARDREKPRGVDLSGVEWVNNPSALASSDCDIVVELIGGHDDPALSLVQSALSSGKTVITANKALLAHHGLSLAALSEETGASLLYEAAIAGGIPIVKLLREGMAANKIDKIFGILNGTCNYILTMMEKTGRDFAEILADAQRKGYAEAEPSLDIDGWDAAHKLCLLSSLAYGIQPGMENITVDGIRQIRAEDLAFAAEFGYRIKLVGQAYVSLDGRIVHSVGPCLVRKETSLANVNGVLNAVYLQGDFVGASFIEGKGAGAGPTASAVVADMMDVARGRHGTNVFGLPAKSLKPGLPVDAEEIISEFYIRLDVLDRPGVIAEVAAILRDHNISIEGLIQRGRDPGQPVMVVLTTHESKKADVDSASAAISKLETVLSAPLILQRLALG